MNSSFLHLFVLFGFLVDVRIPTHIGESPYSLLSLLIQMLISSRNILKDTPRNNILPAIWTAVSPIKLHKINNHKRYIGSSPAPCVSLSLNKRLSEALSFYGEMQLVSNLVSSAAIGKSHGWLSPSQETGQYTLLIMRPKQVTEPSSASKGQDNMFLPEN